jgi:hypothetical protein
MTNSLSPFLINSSAVSRRRRKDGIYEIASRERDRTKLHSAKEKATITNHDQEKATINLRKQLFGESNNQPEHDKLALSLSNKLVGSLETPS